MTGKITGGKVGAILDLRGRNIDLSSGDSYPKDGIIQGYINDLDTFANSLIVQTNNIYASSASGSMISPTHETLSDDSNLPSSDLHIEEGSFDIVRL